MLLAIKRTRTATI